MKLRITREVAIYGHPMEPRIESFPMATEKQNQVLDFLIEQAREIYEVPDGVDYEALWQLNENYNETPKGKKNPYVVAIQLDIYTLELELKAGIVEERE
jgi:hypothetical protein